MLALTPNGSTPPEAAGLADRDDRLLEHLTALVQEVDEIPQSVIEDARATFRSRAEVSQPRRRGGAAIELSFLDLAELLGPSTELDALARGAAADVAGVAARARHGRAGDRPCGTAARATKVDLHTV
jgi:hypothetical protein